MKFLTVLKLNHPYQINCFYEDNVLFVHYGSLSVQYFLFIMALLFICVMFTVKTKSPDFKDNSKSLKLLT